MRKVVWNQLAWLLELGVIEPLRVHVRVEPWKEHSLKVCNMKFYGSPGLTLGSTHHVSAGGGGGHGPQDFLLHLPFSYFHL